MKHHLHGLLVAGLLLLAGCGNPQGPLPVMRLGHAPHDHHAPLYVAAMNPDYFRAHGGIYLKEIEFRKTYDLIAEDRPLARVIVESNTGGEELIRRLAEEQFDLSFGGVPAILNYIDKRDPIHILAPVMAEGAGLIVRTDLPVNSWPEFLDWVRQRDRPLRIGYKASISVQNLIFEQALLASGVPYGTELDEPSSKVVLVNLHGAKHLIPALENGLVDGFVIMQPYLALAESRGSGKLIALLNDLPPNGRWQGHPCCALAANDAFVEKHPEVVDAFTALTLRAQHFLLAHPELSATQVAHWLDLPAAVEARSLPTIQFDVALDDTWDQGVSFWVSSMVDNGKLNGALKDAHRHGALEQAIYDKASYDRARREPE